MASDEAGASDVPSFLWGVGDGLLANAATLGVVCVVAWLWRVWSWVASLSLTVKCLASKIGEMPVSGWLCGALFLTGVVEAAIFAERRTLKVGQRVAGAGAGTTEVPRWARDDAWAETVLEAWDRSGCGFQEERRLTYDCEGVKLYGVLVTNKKKESAGAVVLYHTAAGPRDVFLHWKAHELAHRGFLCFIADVYGDGVGRGWTDAAWTRETRELLATENLLRKRALAAVDALEQVAGHGRIGAIGFCLGGRAALEVAKAADPRLRTAVSFHGVLDDTSPIDDPELLRAKDILVFHGREDPFVDGLANFQAQMRGFTCDVVILAGAKHGFTNPAQALNDNPHFDYDHRSATLAWALAEQRLFDTLRNNKNKEGGGTTHNNPPPARRRFLNYMTHLFSRNNNKRQSPPPSSPKKKE